MGKKIVGKSERPRTGSPKENYWSINSISQKVTSPFVEKEAINVLPLLIINSASVVYSKVQLAKKYLWYWLTASNGKGHGVHSPFVFSFITQVLNDDRHYYCYDTIENVRGQLLKDSTLLAIQDFGAGSRVASLHQRTISFIARSSLKPRKFSRLFFRMVNYFQPNTVIELGTSLGVTAAYMASARPGADILTFEGAKAVAAIARNNFAQLGINNIRIVEGDFNGTLPQVLQQTPLVDFAFVDGNHRRLPTLQYFNQLMEKAHEHSVLVFDDIHWSVEMEQAWAAIKTHPRVTLTIDLFFIGLVFFRTEQKAEQHFVVRF